jgi:hypothetical protein
MNESAPELTRLAAQTANRLRLIQVECADQAPDARESYLTEALEEVIGAIVPEQRKVFLEELRQRFPTWDQHVQVERVAAEATSGKSLADSAEWNDVSFVLERLIQLSQPLDAAQRQTLIDRLQEAGLARVGSINFSPQLMNQFRQKVQATGDEPIDPDRLLEMALRMAEFGVSLDQLGWRLWKAIAPKSPIRQGTPLQKTMRRFVIGDADVPLTRDVENLRHLLASLLAAISQLGKRFAQQHLRKFAPTEIEALVEIEGYNKLFTSKEVLCWRRYKDMSSNLDEAFIDREINQIITDFVGTLPGGVK